MRLRFVVLLVCLLFLGCAPANISVMSHGELLGQAFIARNTHYVPLDSVAALVGASVVYSPLSLNYPDGSQLPMLARDADIIKRDEMVYVRKELLPQLLGIEAQIKNGVISIVPLYPEIEISLLPTKISLHATSAIHYSAEWRDTEFVITIPSRRVIGSLGELKLDGNIFDQVEAKFEESELTLVFFGQYVEGWMPKLSFADSRTKGTITWPQPLPSPVYNIKDGRHFLELAVGEKKPVRLLDAPALPATPTVRLRQRSDMLMGPDSYFPPLKQGFAAGTEGPLLAYTPGWIKTVLNGYEGWVSERAVQLQLITPAFPLSIRSSATVDGEIIGEIPPHTEVVLKEKVNGGYFVQVLGSPLQGYLLDGQLFFESFLHLPKKGLSSVARLAIKDMLPPRELCSGAFLRIIDAVKHLGETILTIQVENQMNLRLECEESTIRVLAGVLLSKLTLTDTPSGTEVGFATDGAFEISANSTSKGLQLTIPFAALHPDFMIPKFNDPITSLTVNQLPNSVEINIGLTKSMAYRIFDSKRVTLMSPSLAGKTIVIDPGHGGKDPGAIGKLQWTEKDYTLDIAQRLAKELEAQDAVTILTHEGVPDDRKVQTEERLMLINRPETDLFLSIHLNAYIQSNQRGAETYYYQGEENLRLAKAMQSSLTRAGMKNRGTILSRTLALLWRGQPPGVVIEVGFITNPEDEKYLSLEQNRQNIAVELAKGIAEYFRR